ncbi:MAG TPA: hypothetical protein VGD67_17720 [Pseudonocardiaceae bacterium]
MTVTAGTGVRPPITPAVTRRHQALAASSFLLATAVVLNSGLGPLAAGAIRYRMAPTLVNQLLALDVVGLVLVAPLAVVAGRLLMRGRSAGAVLAAPPAAFTAYMQAQGIVGGDPLGRAGNAERWFPWHLALFVLSVGILVTAWHTARGDTPPALRMNRARWTAFGLAGAATFVLFGQWLPALADMMSATPSGAGYLAGPAMAWMLALLDLGLLVPALLATAAGLIRGAAWATRAAYVISGFLALVGPAVAAMSVTMTVRDDPAITTGQVVAMCVVGGLLGAFGIAVHRPLLLPFRTAHPS